MFAYHIFIFTILLHLPSFSIERYVNFDGPSVHISVEMLFFSKNMHLNIIVNLFLLIITSKIYHNILAFFLSNIITWIK